MNVDFLAKTMMLCEAKRQRDAKAFLAQKPGRIFRLRKSTLLRLQAYPAKRLHAKVMRLCRAAKDSHDKTQLDMVSHATGRLISVSGSGKFLNASW